MYDNNDLKVSRNRMHHYEEAKVYYSTKLILDPSRESLRKILSESPKSLRKATRGKK